MSHDKTLDDGSKICLRDSMAGKEDSRESTKVYSSFFSILHLVFPSTFLSLCPSWLTPFTAGLSLSFWLSVFQPLFLFVRDALKIPWESFPWDVTNILLLFFDKSQKRLLFLSWKNRRQTERKDALESFCRIVFYRKKRRKKRKKQQTILHFLSQKRGWQGINLCRSRGRVILVPTFTATLQCLASSQMIDMRWTWSQSSLMKRAFTLIELFSRLRSRHYKKNDRDEDETRMNRVHLHICVHHLL